MSTPHCHSGIHHETRLQTRFACLFVFSNSLLSFSTASWGNINQTCKSVWEQRKELNQLAMKTFQFSVLCRCWSRPGRWLTCGFEISSISGKIWLIPGCFHALYYTALRWNSCLHGKISAEEVQFNGKSCCAMFRPESFRWLVIIDVSDVSVSWGSWESYQAKLMM